MMVANWRTIGLETLRLAINMRCAGEVFVLDDDRFVQAHEQLAKRLDLGSVAITVHEHEIALGITSLELMDKLLAATNPQAVGM
jgi:hypothetical protein